MGKSGSSSQANQTTTTNLLDSRVTNGSGIVVRDGSLDFSDRSDNSITSWDSSRTDNSLKSWDSSTTNTNTNTTTGSYNVTADPEIAKAAFDFAKGNDATLGAGLSSMLGLAERLSTNNTSSLTKMASSVSDAVAQAYDGARTTTAGGIDNKTMIILGVAAAGALAFANRKGS